MKRIVIVLLLLGGLGCGKTPTPAEKLAQLGASFHTYAERYRQCRIGSSVGYFGSTEKEYLGKLIGIVNGAKINIAFAQSGDGWACRDAASSVAGQDGSACAWLEEHCLPRKP